MMVQCASMDGYTSNSILGSSIKKTLRVEEKRREGGRKREDIDLFECVRTRIWT